MTERNGRPVAASTVSRNATAVGPSRWLTALRRELPRSPGLAAVATVRLIAVVGLGIDAYVHLDLASTYSEAEAPINEGILFRAEAVLALLTALTLILFARRLSFLAGFLVSASALTLMLVSRYVDLGSLGPFPDLYDPVWFAEKLWAAFGEAAAGIASLAGILLLLSIRAGLRPTGTAPGASGHRGGRFLSRR
jgi:hypothetical protein